MTETPNDPFAANPYAPPTYGAPHTEPAQPTPPAQPYEPTASVPLVPPMPWYDQPSVAAAPAATAPDAGAPSGARPAGRPRRTVALVVAAALLSGATGGGLGAAAVLHHDSTTTATASTGSTSTGHIDPVSLPTGSIEKVAALVLPSVVSIQERATDGSGGTGSGIVLTADGLILTNNHVVVGAATGGQLTVSFQNGQTAAATIVGRDASSDLAVIRVKGVTGLVPATLGKSANLHVGQTVVAVGSPLGLSGTVTSGIVSALDRPVRTGSADATTSADISVLNAIQTDAAINPGNSGGALVDLSGAVVGINSAIASLGAAAGTQSGSIGLGFSIPIDQAKRIADELIATGKATHAQLGISVTETSTGSGAQLGTVTSGGAADQAGLKAGDVVTKVGDRLIESADGLVATIRSYAPGTKVTLTYVRAGETATTTVTLTASTG